jgi:hypothetical protein
MTQKQRNHLPTSEWLRELLDNELESIAEELEQDKKIAPLDFDRLIMYYRENCTQMREYPEVEWVEDWEEDEAA